jgi:hypothetical protein
MSNGAGFIPVVLLAISLIVDRFAQLVTAGGEKALGRAIERVGLFLLIAAAVVFAAVWS